MSGATGLVDRPGIDERLVALHVDDDVAVERFGDFGDPIGAAQMRGLRQPHLSAELRDARRDAQVVGGHDHARTIGDAATRAGRRVRPSSGRRCRRAALPGNRVEANRAGMTATTCGGYAESTVGTVDEGCTANHSTPREDAVLRSDVGGLFSATHSHEHQSGGGVRARRRRRLPGGTRCLRRKFAARRRCHTSRRPRPSMRAAPRCRPKSRGLADVCSPSRRRSARRDLFRFAAPRAAKNGRGSDHPACAAAARRRFRSRPAFRLIGVAEDGAAGSPVRTAIISAPDQLYVVREGERVGFPLRCREDFVRRRRTGGYGRLDRARACAPQVRPAMLASIAIIINPISGGVRPDAARARAELASTIVDRHGDPAEVFVTERAGHARALTRAAVARGARLVMAWGGDGTINEVASTLAFGEVPLGIVPAGLGQRAGTAARDFPAARRCHPAGDRRRATPRSMWASLTIGSSSTPLGSVSTPTWPGDSTNRAAAAAVY